MSTDPIQDLREDLEKKSQIEQLEENWKKDPSRREHVLEVTGVNSADTDILDNLLTWSEIELDLVRAVEDAQTLLQASLVRATLLQAAQLKRIADALENMDDGDSLIRSAQIWGSEQ